MEIGTSLKIQKGISQKYIENFSGMNIQPFFRSKDFYKINHEELNQWFKKAKIKILSLHYPSREDNFIENLKILTGVYKNRLFTIHPSKIPYENYLDYLYDIDQQIKNIDVQLSIENMPFRNDWRNQPDNLYKISKIFPFISITYDITHLPKEIDAIKGIETKLDKVSIIHLSNVKYGFKTKDHLPMMEGERNILNFIKFLNLKNYTSQIILEYKDSNPEFLKKEIEKIREIVIS
jgi:sugar phosphate isomerase/epimerase